MATFFISSPAFDELHLAGLGVARADVLIEACSVGGQTLAYGFVTVRCCPFQSRLDLVALSWIGSIGRAANARELSRAKPRLCTVTADYVRQGADSTAGPIMQPP